MLKMVSQLFPISPSLNSITFCKPKEIARCFATDNICGEISVANTWPVLPTSFAAVIAGSPIPIAMSRTLEPGLISASSISHLLTFSAPFSIVFHHFCQLLATLFQL
jgi:hypothetical protein